MDMVLACSRAKQHVRDFEFKEFGGKMFVINNEEILSTVISKSYYYLGLSFNKITKEKFDVSKND